MLSPEDQQVEICLLKSNLEEIGNALVVQRAALPDLDSENEKKYQETIAALHEARAFNELNENLKLKNIKLTTKRMQLKKQCENVNECINKARENHNELENLLREEDKEIELLIQKYEESLREKADRFRQTHEVYNESKMNNELEAINKNITQLQMEEKGQQNIVKQLQDELNSLVPSVPDNILEIVGKGELDDKLKTLTDQCALLRKTHGIHLHQ